MKCEKSTLNNNTLNKKSHIKFLNESSLKCFLSYSSPKQTKDLLDPKDDTNSSLGKIKSERGHLPFTPLPMKFISANTGRLAIANSSKKRNINEAALSKALTTEIGLASNYFNNTTKVKRFNSSTSNCSKSTSNHFHDDIQELKQINSRLQHSILILKEKRKLMKEQMILKTKEYDVSKLKYEKIINELKDDLAKAGSSAGVWTSARKKNDSQSSTAKHKEIIKSLLCIIIEMCRLYFGDNVQTLMMSSQNKCKVVQIDTQGNNDSKECNQSQMIDQILVLLLGKMEYIKSTLGVSLEEEINKVAAWREGFLIEASNNNNKNYFLSNSSNKKVHLKSASTLTDYSFNRVTNALLLPQSPKFCDEGLVKPFNKSKTKGEVSSKDDSLLKNRINRKNPLTHSQCNDSPSKTLKGKANHEDLDVCKAKDKLNMSECSIGDLVSPSNEPFIHFEGNLDYFTLDANQDEPN